MLQYLLLYSVFACVIYSYSKSSRHLHHHHHQVIIIKNHDLPNAFGAKVPVDTPLNIAAWDSRLQDYHDENVVKFLRYGWPINYTADKLPESSASNHPSAISFSEHVDFYIATELEHGAIAGPFNHNPLPRPLICSPLQTVPKRGSTKRRVVMDLSFPPSCSG